MLPVYYLGRFKALHGKLCIVGAVEPHSHRDHIVHRSRYAQRSVPCKGVHGVHVAIVKRVGDGGDELRVGVQQGSQWHGQERMGCVVEQHAGVVR